MDDGMLSQSTTIDILLGSIGLIGVLTSFLSLMYIVFRLKLNRYIKQILLVNTVQNLVGHLMIAISLVLVIFFHIQNFTTCTFIYGPVIVSLMGGYVMTALIAVIR